MKQTDRMRLALETGISLSTVAKWDKGDGVSESMDRALLKASSELGMVRENEVPPKEPIDG
jgi:DNA-binding transcriptional regulator YiaG